MARTHVVVLLGLALLTGAGCGTTKKQGAVGDTLDSRTLHVTLHRFTERAKAGRAAANVEICRDEEGQAINAYAFVLGFEGGDKTSPTRPMTLYDDEFGVSRAGCERGWIEFPLSPGATPETLRFTYDDTGSARPGEQREEHVEFSWDVAA